ncbi:hypothetical protein phiJL1_ORF142 [Lactobacillus phage phiJL-1]|uniref:Uncharacterized protein n=1 Tax=Lactobacillus phage phiJL-1 TaxID=2892345 RepID=Q597W4_9CAUD|nr:hypothetical protein phiJL1_ORF142 [Lactobacillus phage phiJL-1]AAP74507.1 hypothetical protein [Lactobacillus phage phiJL-1]
MKTKEFIEKAEAMGYKVGNGGKAKVVRDSGGHVLLSVYEGGQYHIDSDYEIPLTPELFSIAVEYAKTPISKRSIKYRVGIKGLSLSTGEKSYLNFDPINNNYFVSDLNLFYKNKFTEDEIYELVNDPDFFLQTGNYETEEAE